MFYLFLYNIVLEGKLSCPITAKYYFDRLNFLHFLLLMQRYVKGDGWRRQHRGSRPIHACLLVVAKPPDDPHTTLFDYNDLFTNTPRRVSSNLFKYYSAYWLASNIFATQYFRRGHACSGKLLKDFSLYIVS